MGPQGLLLGGVAALALGWAVGWQMGTDHEKANGVRQIERVTKAAEKALDKQVKIADTARLESEFARDQVAQVNLIIDQQKAAMQELLDADQTRRVEALDRMEKAAAKAVADSQTIARQARDALEKLRNVADQCATAVIDPDVRRVLDGIRARPQAGADPGSIPAGPSEARP